MWASDQQGWHRPVRDAKFGPHPGSAEPWTLGKGQAIDALTSHLRNPEQVQVWDLCANGREMPTLMLPVFILRYLYYIKEMRWFFSQESERKAGYCPMASAVPLALTSEARPWVLGVVFLCLLLWMLKMFSVWCKADLLPCQSLQIFICHKARWVVDFTVSNPVVTGKRKALPILIDFN